MKIELLTTEMLGFRLSEDREIDPDWFVAHLDDIIRYNPDGCFAFCDGDKTIGMITSTMYQRIGWLGWLFVLEGYRQRGLGEKLMTHAIEHLKSKNAASILLEADVKAISLYKRLGFAEQFHTQHYMLSRVDFECGNRRAAQINSVGPDDLQALADFDRYFFHEDRLGLFRIVTKSPNFRGFVARQGGRIVGYLFVTEASENQQVGPFVVDLSHEHTQDITGALIREALKVSPKPLYFRCSMLDNSSSNPLKELGVKRLDYHTVRMYLGES